MKRTTVWTEEKLKEADRSVLTKDEPMVYGEGHADIVLPEDVYHAVEVDKITPEDALEEKTPELTPAEKKAICKQAAEEFQFAKDLIEKKYAKHNLQIHLVPGQPQILFHIPDKEP